MDLSKLNPINWVVSLFTKSRVNNFVTSIMAAVAAFLVGIGADPADVEDFKLSGGKIATFVVIWAIAQGAGYFTAKK